MQTRNLADNNLFGELRFKQTNTNQDKFLDLFYECFAFSFRFTSQTCPGLTFSLPLLFSGHFRPQGTYSEIMQISPTIQFILVCQRLFGDNFFITFFSSWNFHDVCQRFLYNQKRNFSWSWIIKELSPKSLWQTYMKWTVDQYSEWNGLTICISPL